MRRTKSWIVGIACGALCAVCVFMYLQDAGAQVDAARAEGQRDVLLAVYFLAHFFNSIYSSLCSLCHTLS